MTVSTLGDERIKHLEFIQAVINRYANSAFLVRGWALTIVAAFFAVVATRFEPLLAAVAVVPLSMFWVLDGYFLWQERLYRKLYDDVRRPTSTVEAMSMDASGYVGQTGWFDAIRSNTLVLFYGPLVALALALVIAAAVATI
jgi:hypothetical protein